MNVGSPCPPSPPVPPPPVEEVELPTPTGTTASGTQLPATQTPASQAWPAGHALPQPPQCAGSLLRSTHAPSHRSAGGHMQVPASQTQPGPAAPPEPEPTVAEQAPEPAPVAEPEPQPTATEQAPEPASVARPEPRTAELSVAERQKLESLRAALRSARRAEELDGPLRQARELAEAHPDLPEPQLVAAEIAMKRAAHKAREKARKVGAGVVVMKDGQIVEERQDSSSQNGV